jgi:hypothetical protein
MGFKLPDFFDEFVKKVIRKYKKTLDERNGESDSSERGVPVSYSRRSGLCRCSCRSSHYAKE